MSTHIIVADCLEALRRLPNEMVHCCVTSPPYWGLRDYGTARWEGGDPACDHRSPTMRDGRNEDRPKLAGSVATNAAQLKLAHRSGCGRCGAIKVDAQMGLEATLGEHLSAMVDVFREVRRVLRKDGTLWLNYGDAYAGAPNGRSAADTKAVGNDDRTFRDKPMSTVGGHLKPKDRMLLPARLAIALQESGWWVRDEIVWHKPNPMPSSVSDRTTPAHEMIYLLTRSARYFYDAAAIREPRASDEDANTFRGGSYVGGEPGKRKVVGNRRIKIPGGWDIGAGAHGTIHREGITRAKYKTLDVAGTTTASTARRVDGFNDRWDASGEEESDGKRNKRSVWTIASKAFKEAHFATFPPALIEPCIKAGSPVGGTVLDPFGGAGTTGLVAQQLGRNAVLIELNPQYADIARRRIGGDVRMHHPTQRQESAA